MMTFFKRVVFVCCLFLPTALAAQDFKWIQTEAEFRTLVVGKKLWFNTDNFTIKGNGALTGNFGGKRLQGAWAWRDQYWCRTLTTHSKNTDCQKWETDGKTFRVTRGRGAGKSFVYTLKR